MDANGGGTYQSQQLLYGALHSGCVWEAIISNILKMNANAQNPLKYLFNELVHSGCVGGPFFGFGGPLLLQMSEKFFSK